MRRRSRGRHGLDAVAELQRAPAVRVHLVEEFGVDDVAAALVRLAREREVPIVARNVIQTATGRMVFAQLQGPGAP